MEKTKKTCVRFLNTFNRKYENKEKSKISFVDVKILSNNQTQQYLHIRPKGLKKTPTQVLFCEISELFKNTFFNRTGLVATSDI